ncbi:hypothetical protein [Actinophytocola gossypii]|uniref:TPM domain-containing protein n=1 Tax=Actinophytocola gossypii TaxID=2812003 RepID=A0ABT2JCW9_9PSEU|nr:hypothetical protein [Actinophytocola gossypii]MCT2585702.1 hypothetical protein [Actinophytocola gossypii]
MKGLFGTAYGLSVLGCLVLAGWALFTGGILDGEVAREVRTTSVYAAEELGIDERAAERIIGNRRLVVILQEPGADLRETCDDVQGAADDNVILLLSHDGDEYDTYGCAQLGDEDENLGDRVVADTVISNGVDSFVDDPLSALKVVAVNYDLLVRAGIVPDGARTISPSLPRYLIAGTAVAAVLVAASVAYLGARRAGRSAAERRERRDSAEDERTALSARSAVLAQEIIALDRRFHGRNAGKAERRYRSLAAEYADLVGDIADADEHDQVDSGLALRVESLIISCRELSDAQERKRKKRKRQRAKRG